MRPTSLGHLPWVGQDPSLAKASSPARIPSWFDPTQDVRRILTPSAYSRARGRPWCAAMADARAVGQAFASERGQLILSPPLPSGAAGPRYWILVRTEVSPNASVARIRLPVTRIRNSTTSPETALVSVTLSPFLV